MAATKATPANRCPRSGKRIAKAALRRGIYVQGQGWLTLCPTCGAVPGSTTPDGGCTVLYAEHERQAGED